MKAATVVGAALAAGSIPLMFATLVIDKVAFGLHRRGHVRMAYALGELEWVLATPWFLGVDLLTDESEGR